jgi:hypothetical protein
MTRARLAAFTFVLALPACASDPFADRLEDPRLGATGWVAVEPIEADPSVAQDYAAAVREAAAALDARIAPGCAGPRVAVLQGAERLAASDEALADIAGEGGSVVRERVAVAACGETREHLVYPMEGRGAPVYLTGVPGASIASLGLQRDVVDQAMTQAAGIVAAGQPEGACDAMANEPWVLDTVLVEPPRKGRWRERWIMTACGERRTIDIAFEETETGARFSAPIPLTE